MTVLTARAAVRARPLPPPAALAAGGAVLIVLIGLLLVQARGSWSAAAVAELPVDAAIGLTYPLVGAVVLRGNRPLGRVFLIVGLAAAVVVLTTAYAAVAPAATPLALAAAWLQSWLWAPAFVPLLTLLPLLYPDGRLLWRWVGVSAVAGTALVSLALALHDEDVVGRVVLEKPFTADALAVPAGVAGLALLVPAVVGGLASLGVRLRRADPLVRRQVLVFLGAAAVLVAEAVAHGSLPERVSAVTQPVAVVLLPLAVGVAVTRHRLYDLDVALLRLLVGVSLVGCLVGGYVAVVAVLSVAVPSLALPLAAGLVGLVVQPLAVRLSRAADRMYYGDRADPYAVLTGLTARLSDGAVGDVPEEICSAVVRSLRLRAAELVLGERTVALVGEPDGPQEEIVLRHRGELIGRFVVTARPGETVLAERDRELVQALAAAAAPALSVLGLNAELRASREALVAGREEERRRLRRDLHDGIGAALAGARLQLESARDLVRDERAVRMLDAAGAAVTEAVDDVRRLTEDLRPPALDELGLGGCLVGLAERVRTPALEVAVQVPAALPALPAAVEVAAYRIAGEALVNAARHAGASVVAVRLEVEPGRVVLEVRDDGRGLPGSPRAGVGLASMRQRAEEIGGGLQLHSDARGTIVRAVLPT